MTQIIETINALAAIAVYFLAVICVIGGVKLITLTAAHHRYRAFLLGVVFTSFALYAALRTFYWDLVPYLLGRNMWDWFFVVSGGRSIPNTIFNIIAAVGLTACLRIHWYLIPSEDRCNYFWLTAAVRYPPKGLRFRTKDEDNKAEEEAEDRASRKE